VRAKKQHAKKNRKKKSRHPRRKALPCRMKSWVAVHRESFFGRRKMENKTKEWLGAIGGAVAGAAVVSLLFMGLGQRLHSQQAVALDSFSLAIKDAQAHSAFFAPKSAASHAYIARQAEGALSSESDQNSGEESAASPASGAQGHDSALASNESDEGGAPGLPSLVENSESHAWVDTIDGGLVAVSNEARGLEEMTDGSIAEMPALPPIAARTELAAGHMAPIALENIATHQRILIERVAVVDATGAWIAESGDDESASIRGFTMKLAEGEKKTALIYAQGVEKPLAVEFTGARDADKSRLIIDLAVKGDDGVSGKESRSASSSAEKGGVFRKMT